MLYPIDRTLFLENGPTLLAERDHRRRLANDIYRLLRTAPLAAPADPALGFKAAA